MMNLAQVLDVPAGEHPDWAQLVNQGLPTKSVEALAERLQVPVGTLAALLPVSLRTLQRRAHQTLPPELSDHLVDIGKVYLRAVDVLKTEEYAADWICSKIPALSYQVPLQLLATRIGTQQVLDVLGRLEHGVFS